MRALGYGVAVPVAGHDFWRIECGMAQTPAGARAAEPVVKQGVAVALIRLDDLDTHTNAITSARERGQEEGRTEIIGLILQAVLTHRWCTDCKINLRAALSKAGVIPADPLETEDERAERLAEFGRVVAGK